MLVSKHILYGAIFSLFFYIITPYPNFIPFLIIFFSSFLVDADHYLIYVWRKKDLSLIKAYKWHINLKYDKDEEKRNVPFPHFFHSFEFFILLVLLSFLNKIFIYVLLGFLLHSCLDLYQLLKEKRLYCREYFLTRWLIRKIKNKRK